MPDNCANCGSHRIYHQDECSYCGGQFHFTSVADNCVADRREVKYRPTSKMTYAKTHLRQCPHCEEWLIPGHGSKATTEVHATETYAAGIEIIETVKRGKC
mgnify:FL=1